MGDFMAPGASLPAILKSAEEVYATLEGEDASLGKYYLKVMGNIIKKGITYPKTEFGRLIRMIDSGSVREEKEAEFKSRLNILKVFDSTLKESDFEEVEEEEEAKEEL